MGVKVRGLGSYTAYLRSESKRIGDVGERVAQDAANYGADLMREFIRTRGTRYSRSQGREGRTETWEMHNAVRAGRPRRLSGGGVSVTYGWGVDGSPREDYFFYQEHGFPHNWTGEMVPPMHALLDSLVRTREFFYARVRNELSKR